MNLTDDGIVDSKYLPVATRLGLHEEAKEGRNVFRKKKT
jgi:1,4-dihydroxy-2-naphthoyl-CoA synthase